MGTDDKFFELLKRMTAHKKISSLGAKGEDALINLVAKINNIYQDTLELAAPFVTFMLIGMQSTGKSTLVERFLNAVMNIGESSYFPCNVKLLSRYDHYPSKCCLIFVVQEGTGTRCPLDVTVIYNSSLSKP